MRADQSNSVQLLVFDLGGVVMEIDFSRVLSAWATAAGADPAGLRRRFPTGQHEQFERGELEEAAFFAAVRSDLGVDLSDDVLRAGWGDIFVGPMPGMRDLLAAAADRLPVYGFTNTDLTHEKVWRTRFADQLESFSGIFTSTELHARKPERVAFEAVISQLDVPAGDVLFFDDTEANVTGAKAAGLQAALVHDIGDIRSALSTLGITADSVEL